jgi:hypothetical protein
MREKRRRGPKKKFKAIDPKEMFLPIESNEYFSFIAGYTSGGAAYGLTWEEFNQADQEKYSKTETIQNHEHSKQR